MEFVVTIDAEDRQVIEYTDASSETYAAIVDFAQRVNDTPTLGAAPGASVDVRVTMEVVDRDS